MSAATVRNIVYAQAVRTALLEEMRRDPTVIVMGEDIGVYGGVFGATKGLMREFGDERVRDTPIAEAALVGMAAGAAMAGLRPVVELMYSDFTATAMDPIVNNVAKFHYMSGGQLRLPLVIRTPAGGGVGYGAQHSQSPETWFTHVPGLKVVMPAMPVDARGLLKSAIRDPNPVLFFEHKGLYTRTGPVPSEETLVPIGEAEVKRAGSDVTLVCWSKTLWDALEAAETLAADGIGVEVVDLRTLQPLDVETIVTSVGKTGRLVVAHEATLFAGLGAEISATICERCPGDLKAPPARVGGKFAPVAFAESMESFVLPSRDEIAAAVRRVVAE